MRVIACDQVFDCRRDARGDFLFRQSEIGEPQHFALAHRDAAEDLGEIFAGADADQQFLQFAEAARFDHARRVAGKLPDRLDIGSQPGIAVGRMLFALERGRGNLSGLGHLGPQRGCGFGEKRLSGVARFEQKRQRAFVGVCGA